MLCSRECVPFVTPYVLCSRESQCSVGDCSYVFSSRESVHVFEFYFQCFRKVAPLIISFPVYRIYHKFSLFNICCVQVNHSGPLMVVHMLCKRERVPLVTVHMCCAHVNVFRS